MPLMDEELRPIQPYYEAFYIEALASHTTTVLMLCNRVNRVIGYLEQIPKEKILVLKHSVLDDLQNIISNAAALSKYFWPPSNKQIHQDRAHQLREVFSVTDDSPIKSRDLRNAIEHFDERLDIFCQDLRPGETFPFYVGAKGEDDGMPRYFFRAYFTDTAYFRLLEKEYAINPLIEEVARIDDILTVHRNCGRFYK